MVYAAQKQDSGKLYAVKCMGESSNAQGRVLHVVQCEWLPTDALATPLYRCLAVDADKRMIKARHATRMIVNERDILASVDHPFITGLQYAFQDDAEASTGSGGPWQLICMAASA